MSQGKPPLRSDSADRVRGGVGRSSGREASADPDLLRRAELEEELERLSREKRTLERDCAALRDQRDTLDQILESLPYPFYVIDADSYRVIKSNAAAHVGNNGGGTTCHELTHGCSAPCGSLHHPCPLRVMRRTKAPVVVEHVHLAEDGTPFHAEVHAFPILDEHGKLVRMIEYSIDISARKLAEAEREERVHDLEVALANVRTLHGLLPICAACKKIRDDDGYWKQVEEYILEHSDAEFSHSYCPDCAVEALKTHRTRK